MDPNIPNPAQTPVVQPTVIEVKSAPLICKYCKHEVLADSYFCLNCGKKLKDKPLSTTIGRQIYLYTFSILFPPLGLWPGIKYLFVKDNSKAQIIGVILIVLTIVSTIVTVKITLDFLNGAAGSSQQILDLQNAGY